MCLNADVLCGRWCTTLWTWCLKVSSKTKPEPSCSIFLRHGGAGKPTSRGRWVNKISVPKPHVLFFGGDIKRQCYKENSNLLVLRCFFFANCGQYLFSWPAQQVFWNNKFNYVIKKYVFSIRVKVSFFRDIVEDCSEFSKRRQEGSVVWLWIGRDF